MLFGDNEKMLLEGKKRRRNDSALKRNSFCLLESLKRRGLRDHELLLVSRQDKTLSRLPIHPPSRSRSLDRCKNQKCQRAGTLGIHGMSLCNLLEALFQSHHFQSGTHKCKCKQLMAISGKIFTLINSINSINLKKRPMYPRTPGDSDL